MPFPHRTRIQRMSPQRLHVKLDGSLDFGGGVNDLNASRDQDGQEFQEEKDEASAMEGDGTGPPQPTIAGALPRHKWHRHTVKVTRIFRNATYLPGIVCIHRNPMSVFLSAGMVLFGLLSISLFCLSFSRSLFLCLFLSPRALHHYF